MKLSTVIVIGIFCGILFFTKAIGQASAPSALPQINTFSTAPDNIGKVQNTVNLFTGDLNLPISLVSLTGKEGLGVNVAISYNSNVQNQVDTWNLESPGGILGLGWTMDMPRIICDHKSTGTREDDTYYLLEGQTSNRLVRIGHGSDAIGLYNTYATKKYQFWQIKFYYDPTDYALTTPGPSKWVIVRENGFKYIYGDKNSGRSTVQYTVRWGNWIGNSSNTNNQTRLATTWNLSEINNLWGEKVTFEYTNVDQFVGSNFGQKQTEASYLKQIVDPIGRKVQFFYNNKNPQYYMEPHTEQPEPDAYQENYEKLYLDHIDVLQETGTKYLSVNFRYSSINDGINTAKMLLAYIEQRNGAGQALPGIRFDYFTSTGSTGYKGFLQKITYPTGGTVSYTYAMSNNQIGHSNRSLTISGGGEPQLWFGSDYVVVAWRALDSNGNHTSNPSPVSISVYQWFGEWVPSTLSGVNLNLVNVGATFNNNTFHYNNFQVVTEDKFFAILTQPGDQTFAGNNASFAMYYKDEAKRGNWICATIDNSSSLNYLSYNLGSGSATLLSGDNFVAIATYTNSNSTPGYLFTYNGGVYNGHFNQALFPVNINSARSGVDNFYTASNNFVINYSEWFANTVQLTFSYLNEERNWVTTSIPQSLVWANTGPKFPSNLHSSNNFMVAMAGNNPEFLFRWDNTYTNFYRDNDNSTSLLLYWDDNSYVFPINNSQFALIDGSVMSKAVRFDGNNWILSGAQSTNATNKVGSGIDFLVSASPDNSYRTLSVFNANSLNWTSNSISNGFLPLFSGGQASADFYVTNGSMFYHNPDGSWTSTNSTVYGDIAGRILTSGGDLKFVKNGTLSPNSDNIGQNTVYFSDYDQFGNLVTRINYGFDMLACYQSPPGKSYMDANSITLYKNIAERATGYQVDYPVSSITISGNGSTDQNVAFGYNFSTAFVDPSGNVAQYTDVNVIPGSNTPSSMPNGYTTTSHKNGAYGDSLRFLGYPYQIITYDVNNNPVSSTKITYTSYSVPLFLNGGQGQVEVAYYIKATKNVKTSDGITITTTNTFNRSTGQLRNSSTTGSSSSIYQEYKYWYEVNDPNFQTNLLTPLLQVSKKINGTYSESQVTRYKNWPALNPSLGTGATVPAPYDQLVWNGNNVNDISFFSSWDPVANPSSTLADWTMAQQINVRDNYTGAVLETQAKGNIPSAVILDQYKIRPLAKVGNANYNQVAYTSFEDNTNGNWQQWTDGSISSTAAKTGNNSMSIGTNGLQFNQVISGENYIISFWAQSANSGTLTVNGSTTQSIPSAWTYYEFPFTGSAQLNAAVVKLASGNVTVDEVRLYPKRGNMETTTYDLVFGPTSKTDNNNHTAYLQYDPWGRLINTFDENKNVIRQAIYTTKQ